MTNPGIRNGRTVSYYQPHKELTVKPTYKVGDIVYVNGRKEPWMIEEIASTGFEGKAEIGYWFKEQPLFPLYEHELWQAGQLIKTN